EPAITINAVDGKDFDLAGVYKRFNGSNQMEAFVFQVVGRGRGEKQERKTIVTIGHNLHVFIQTGTVPAIENPIHEFFLLVCCSISHADRNCTLFLLRANKKDSN